MSPNDTTVRAVIFDYGGVLTTSGRATINAWTEDEGIQPETVSSALKEWLSRDAPPGTPIHRLETGELPQAEFNRMLAGRLRTTDGGPVQPDGLVTRLFSHARRDLRTVELIRELRANGIRTALLSNSWGNNYPRAELEELFEFLVISGEIGLRKPDPRVYERTLTQLGLTPRQAVFVDDARPNIEAAQRLGLHTVTHASAAETRAHLAELLPLQRTVEEP